MPLTVGQEAVVNTAIEMLEGNREHPLSQDVADKLAENYSVFGYDSKAHFLESLRDAPYSTLLRSLVAAA